MTRKTQRAKQRAADTRSKPVRARPHAAQPRRRSNAHSPARVRASAVARALARVADGVPKPERCPEHTPLAKRLLGFLTDLMNGGAHKPALHAWRLDWAADIVPRLLKGDRYDEEFAESYAAAKEGGEMWRDQLVTDDAYKLVLEGRLEPLFQGGKFCGVFPRFDNQFHMLLLKAGNPSRYAEHHKISGELDEPPVGVVLLPAAVPAPRAK